jgi:polysaccharide biosynthesis/export protein
MFQRTNICGWLAVLLLCTGCHSLRKHPLPPPVLQPADVPRELCKATIPEYIIEPPDVLTIDAIRLLPRQPYQLQPLDTLAVQINDNTGAPIFETTAAIDPSGRLPLGPLFGSVAVSGLTVEEVRRVVHDQVAQTFANPLIAVDIVQLALLQQIAGEHLVGPDGTVNLGIYGQVRVAGLSIPAATEAIQRHLAPTLDQPRVAVDVFGFNSKFYYVISEGAGLGDQVNRFPYMGNETVLDAISNVQGMTAVSSKHMWIARPGRNDQGGEQVLPVDWKAVSMRGDVATNYQLMPGDRVFIAEDPLVAYDNHLAKRLAPLERIAGVMLLVTQTIQRLVYFDQGPQGLGGGF